MPPATAAAEPPDEPPGTRSRSHGLCVGAVSRVLGRRAHGELVHVRLAERRQARLLELRRHGRVEHRHVAGEDLRAGGGLDALGRDHVLDRDRHARALALLCDFEIGMDLAVTLGDRIQIGAMQLLGARLAALDQARRLLGGQAQRIDGTRHRPELGRRRLHSRARLPAPARAPETGAARRRRPR